MSLPPTDTDVVASVVGIGMASAACVPLARFEPKMLIDLEPKPPERKPAPSVTAEIEGDEITLAIDA